MTTNTSSPQNRLTHQKKIWYLCLVLSLVLFIGLMYFLFSSGGASSKTQPVRAPSPAHTVSDGINQDNLRIAELEKRGEVQANELEYLKSKLEDFKEDREVFSHYVDELEEQVGQVKVENDQLKNELQLYQSKQQEKDLLKSAQTFAEKDTSYSEEISDFVCWGTDEPESEAKNVRYVIPPGTLVKGVIVQGVSQPVGVGKPADPEVALIRITSAGKLPKKLRVALKGSNLICSTESILSNRRVRVRGETLSKHEKSGDFTVTDVCAVVSGPGGKSGVPARVISYGGVQAGYAAVSSAMGAATSTLETVLNNQTIEKLSQIGPDKAILNSDVFTNIGLRGTNGGFEKLTDYYVKMADLYNPVLEIDMGTEVSILFTTAVTIGEKNVKKKLLSERGERLHEATVH